MDVLRTQALLVDDHPLFRAGLALMIGREPDLEVVGQAGSAEEAIDVVRSRPVDVAIIDVLMPGTSGISLASQLVELVPGVRILALSVLDEPTVVASMLRAGATGYALKAQPPDEVLEAIRTVVSGVRYLPEVLLHTRVLSLVEQSGPQPLQRLTPREREIFDLLIRGHTNDEIGSRLFIARRTVETHRQRIMKKLATHSLVDMIRVAAREGALAE